MTAFDPAQDEFYMREALRLARQAAQLGEVPVGAVVVQDGRIIGRGYNLRETAKDGLAHAELMAIRQASQVLGGWRLVRCQLVVTLEPCPMCAGAVINSRIERVVYGAADPKAGSLDSVQRMFSYPYNHLPPVRGGVLKEECVGILQDFFRGLRQEKKLRPWKKQENSAICTKESVKKT